MNKNYRLLLKLHDYDNGIVHIYGKREKTRFHILLVGEYGDQVEVECTNLQTGIDSACFQYFGINIDYRANRVAR